MNAVFIVKSSLVVDAQMPAIVIDHCTYSVSITITCGSPPACFVVHHVHCINFCYNVEVHLIKYWWHNHCNILYGLSNLDQLSVLQKMLGMWTWGYEIATSHYVLSDWLFKASQLCNDPLMAFDFCYIKCIIRSYNYHKMSG